MTQNNAKFNTIGTDAYGDISGSLTEHNTTGSMTVIKIQHNDVLDKLPDNGNKLTWIFGGNRWEPVAPAQFLIGPANFHHNAITASNGTALNIDTITTYIYNNNNFYVECPAEGQIMIVHHTCPAQTEYETIHTFVGSTINGTSYYTTPLTKHRPTILMAYGEGLMVELGNF